MIKVNNQERYVFGILEIAMVVRDTLEYFVANPQGYDVGKYQARREILKNMTASNSPFYSFCAQNGLGYKTDEKGKEVLDESGKKIKNRGQSCNQDHFEHRKARKFSMNQERRLRTVVNF